MSHPFTGRAALEDALSSYTTAFQGGSNTEVLPASFQERVETLVINFMNFTPSTEQEKEDLALYSNPSSILREIAELYVLLIILHRDTNHDLLLADGRLRLSGCAREEVPARVQFSFGLTKTINHSEELIDWRALLEVSHEPLREEYYTARRKILALHGVDEAFVEGKSGHVSIVFTIRTADDCDGSPSLLYTLPNRVAQLQVAQNATTSIAMPEKRTRLFFDEIAIDCKLESPSEICQFVRSILPAPVPVRELSVELSSEWTPEDGRAFTAAIDAGVTELLTLSVRSASQMLLALEIFAHVQHVTAVKILLKFEENWSEDFAEKKFAFSETDAAMTVSTGPRKLTLLTYESPANMTDQVAAVLPVLECVSSSTRAKIDQCEELRLKTRVDERDISDFQVVLPLLSALSKSLTTLQMDSCSYVEDFDQWAYIESPGGFDLEPILRACPKLRSLTVQTATLNGLPALYEKRLTKLEALRVQWPPAQSTLALVEALGDPSSAIARHLVEFSTRRSETALVAACVKTLAVSNPRMRYLRLGRSAASPELTAQLLQHHHEKLALTSPEIERALDQVADTVAPTTSARLDESVLETIAEFYGPPVYRQVSLW